MENPLTTQFFRFDEPAFGGISAELFTQVKESYRMSVIEAVIQVANEFQEETLAFANFVRPELRTVLARQRRDYGLDDEQFPAEYPVELQALEIDDTPVNDMAMERLLGKTDQRLKKTGDLNAVSRSLVLQRGKAILEKSTSSMHSFRNAAAAKREVELKWKESVAEKFRQGADEKQLIAQRQERKRLDLIQALKDAGGPFTEADEVQSYLDNPAINEKVKNSRMKKEIQFARDSSTTLPKSDALFRIQVTKPDGKRRDKTAVEFGTSLMVFLGKKMASTDIELNTFKESLEKYTNAE